jgi:TRAP-type mannitol/chloroaromatic compound transport system permease small subunit
MKPIRYFLRYTDWVNAKFAWFVAFMMLPTLIIMMWEIVMRYFFNKPSLWAYETSLFMYGSYIALGGAYTLLVSGHVNVDIFWGRLSPRWRSIVDVITSTLFFLFVGLLFKESLEATVNAWQIGEHTMTQWSPPYYPLRTSLPVASFLLLLQGLAKLIRDLNTAITGKETLVTTITVKDTARA